MTLESGRGDKPAEGPQGYVNEISEDDISTVLDVTSNNSEDQFKFILHEIQCKDGEYEEVCPPFNEEF